VHLVEFNIVIVQWITGVVAATEDNHAGSVDDKEMSDDGDEDEDSDAGDDDDDKEVDAAVRDKIRSALGDAAAHSDIEVLEH